MSAEVTEHQWTEKSQLSGHLGLALVGLIALGFAYLKIKPYLGSPIQVHPYTGRDQAEHRSADAERKDKDFRDLITHQMMPHFGSLPKANGRRESGAVTLKNTAVQIIERPMFDGLAVTVHAILTRGISSLEPDTTIEARIVSLVKSEESAALDDTEVRGAKLTGVAAPNMDLKRFTLNFSELVTLDGRSIQIQATAINAATQTQGVPADYASGVGSRLLGVGISQVLSAGDQILMAKLLPDPSNAVLTQQVTIQAARQMNDRAATDLNMEATHSLRDTKVELSLPAGTSLTLRLRVSTGHDRPGGGS